MNNKVAAFGQRRAGVYLLSEIYNPDDTSSSVQNINKVIPAVGSIVVDDTVGEHNTLYVVYSVDAVTHRSTLVNIEYNSGEDDINNLRMLFFSSEPTPYYYPTTDLVRQSDVTYYTLSNDEYSIFEGSTFTVGTTYYEKKNLYELHVDERVSVYTSLGATYTIYHAASMNGVDSSTEVVSQYYVEEDPYGNKNLIERTEVPMDKVVIPATDAYGQDTTTDAYRPRTCYTTERPKEGDTYLVIVRKSGSVDQTDIVNRPRVVSQFTLTGHSMSHLVALNNDRRTIASITVGGNQYNSNENYFFITQDQRLDHLAFFLTVNYTNGYSETVNIDNVNAFIYMEENVNTASAGSESKIVFKYFPSPSENLGLGTGRGYTIGPTGRYITLTSKIKTIQTAFSVVSRIVPIFVYNPGSNPPSYIIKPLCYHKDYSEPVVIGDYSTSATAVTGYNSTLTTDEQTIGLVYYYENSNTNSPLTTYTENYTIRLYSLANANSSGIYYYFRHPGADTGVIFGKDPRPTLRQTSGNNYTFSVSTTSGQYSAKEYFLKNYYYNANPPSPFSASDTQQPTHFRIRKVTVSSNNVIIDSNIAYGPESIDSFFAQDPSSQIIATDQTSLHSTSTVPATAVLEFLTQNANNTYNVIFGVPIDVIKA